MATLIPARRCVSALDWDVCRRFRLVRPCEFTIAMLKTALDAVASVPKDGILPCRNELDEHLKIDLFASLDSTNLDHHSDDRAYRSRRLGILEVFADTR
ncbi:hypothetical protein KOR42_21930 [Thalassoglobus neptunius]|uniref:Uncharacterized protein n=1 Tax=Thalassoglobus neptunius TaxID=1938619 RepID=A0A5C5X6R6_9PLAN|nr:hypothetical protein KOR42_21930 [Thalassoglobus neptunius]